MASEEKLIEIGPYRIHEEYFRIFQHLIVPASLAKHELTEGFWII